MDFQLNRRDVGYTIISRFEVCLREFMSEKMQNQTTKYLELVPQGIIDKARDRSGRGDWESVYEFLEDVEFPDLKEIILYKNSKEKYLNKTDLEGLSFEHTMDDLYYLRCKIAHVRGYFTSLDLDKLVGETKEIARLLAEQGKDFVGFISVLEKQPEKVVVQMPAEFSCEYFKTTGIPNNIPSPDYEYEGGFVGREGDIKKIVTLLEGDRYPVVTIAGAGGVGKTALAQRVIQKILEKKQHKFDGVVWVSAKETRLSYVGIEDIEPTIKNYEELLGTISDVLGYGKNEGTLEEREAKIKTICDHYSCVLMVIDNLETITDDRTINFILEASPRRKILVTSRKGLGQVEIRHELKQLTEKEAVYLFRQIARDKGLDALARLEFDLISKYVKKVSCYPLAIKWVIGQVARGKDIHGVVASINEKTSDISRFCFEQVFSGLTAIARKIICALSVFETPPPAGVLKYVVNISSKHEFEDGMQELILVSLVIPEQYKDHQGMISTKYSLLAITKGYVAQQLDRDTVLKRDIEERLRSVHDNIEAGDRARQQYRFSLANLGANSEEEQIAAMLAQTAFQKYQSGFYAEALDDYKRAVEIAPHFPSIYRNWAVMESQEGHVIDADALMEKAVKLNNQDPQIWLTWGNMKRKGGKIREALEKYQKAERISPEDYVILNALGQARCRLGEHQEADRLFKLALKNEIYASSRKHEIINLASIAENLRRWSEILIKDRNRALAEEKNSEAFSYCKKLVELDPGDYKSRDLYQDILIRVAWFAKNTDQEKAIKYYLMAMSPNPTRYKEAKGTFIAAINAAKLLHALGKVEKGKEVLNSISIRHTSVFKENPSLRAEYERILKLLSESK